MKQSIGVKVGLVACFLPVFSQAVQTNVPPVTVLPEVVVTASRREMLLRDTPDLVQVIDRKAIEQMKPSTTGELLEYATGAAVSSGTGSGFPDRRVVGLNGLPANYTLVLLNGVPLLTDHMHTGQNLEYIPPSSIERIEVMRGAASAQYGADAIGGIVNIITRTAKPDRQEGDVGVAIGRYNTQEGSFSLLTPAGSRARISSFMNWERSDGLPLKAPANRLGNTGYNRFNMLNRVDATVDKATDMFFWLNWVEGNMETKGGEMLNSTLVTPVVGVNHEISSTKDVAAQVAYSDWQADSAEERNRLLKPEAHMTWQVGGDHTLTGGGEYRWNEFSRTSVEKLDQQAYGAFVQDDWVASDLVTVMTALRYDKVEDVEGSLSPKLSVMVSPSEEVRLRGSVGRGFHAPTLMEMYEEGYGHGGTAYRFGNPDLDPEYSTTYTAGLEVKPVETVTLMLNGFYSDLDDMIVPVYEGAWDKDPSINVWRRQNIKNAQVYGGEVGVRVRVGEYVSLEGGYTHTENEDKDTGRQLPYSPGSSVNGKVTVGGKVSKTLRATGFVGARAGFGREAWNWKPAPGVTADDPDGLTTKLEDYTALDAGVTLGIGSAYECFVKVENLLGEDIENLDDSYTVLDGEPFVRVGFNYKFQ